MYNAVLILLNCPFHYPIALRSVGGCFQWWYHVVFTLLYCFLLFFYALHPSQYFPVLFGWFPICFYCFFLCQYFFIHVWMFSVLFLLFLFVFYAFHPSQYFFSHVWMFSYLPWLMQHSVMLNDITECLN